MMHLTKETLADIARTNFHKSLGVDIPARVTLAQLYRWLVFEFVPLPEVAELQLAHLPIFDPRIRRLAIRWEIGKKITERARQLLMDGALAASGSVKDQESAIPQEYWHLPLQSIQWERSEVALDEFQIRVFSESTEEGYIALNRVVSEYKKKYGALAYSAVNIATEDIIRVFDGLRITDDHIVNLKKQAAVRVLAKGNVGAKPQHDWDAYEKQFDALMVHYGTFGIDQPGWENQAAAEKKLLEWGQNKFGEAPGSSTIRRYAKKWLGKYTR